MRSQGTITKNLNKDQPVSLFRLERNALVIFFLVLFISVARVRCQASSPLRLPLTVKETAGVEVTQYPITVVVPLPYGQYQDTRPFRVVDSAGTTIPAQFQVLNRWWIKDMSIRHLMIHFQPTVAAFYGEGSGITTYYLQNDASENCQQADTPLQVQEASESITVTTGPLKFTVSKKRFTILDEVWLDKNHDGKFQTDEQIINAHGNNGGIFVGRSTGDVQYDSARDDISVIVEETGPLRVVIRAEALTKYYGVSSHIHGFAVRIYAYANKPYVKIDYQLQNSAKNVATSGPLYFEKMDIDFKLNLENEPDVTYGLGDGRVYKGKRGSGLCLTQEFHDKCNVYSLKAIENLKTLEGSETPKAIASGKMADGFIDVSDSTWGVLATTRYFWEMWPNGLSIDDQNKISIQLFPWWGAQFYEEDVRPPKEYKNSPTGLYWFEDMQHVYKEIMLYFHGTELSDKEYTNFSKVFKYHPVATLPISWYKETKCTLDLDGCLPNETKLTATDKRQPIYLERDYQLLTTSYVFNWDNFKIYPHRKRRANDCGEGPNVILEYITDESPKGYYDLEQHVIGELNVRPQWIAQYDYQKDTKDRNGPQLQLNDLFNTWRKLNMPYVIGGNPSSYLEGTGKSADAKDQQHLWVYVYEDAYYITGNLWIKDWYTFMAEMREMQLLQGLQQKQSTLYHAPHCLGHSSANVLQAYRVTGRTQLLSELHNFFKFTLEQYQDPQIGELSFNSVGIHGYLARALITYMHEIEGVDIQSWMEAFTWLSSFMEWNVNFSNFSYACDERQAICASAGGGAGFTDPQAWYYWHTGKQKYLDHLERFITTGINGGGKSYCDFTKWVGGFDGITYGFTGRYVIFVRNTFRSDKIPPDKIDDLTASFQDHEVHLHCTFPQEAVKYLLVWSDKPISEKQTLDINYANWWKAHIIGGELSGNYSPSVIKIASPPQGRIYAAIFTFDDAHNMSAMSNITSIDVDSGNDTGGNEPEGEHTIYSIHPGQSIQTVIDTADNGDVVILHEGTYKENITFSDKAITVKSTDPNDNEVVAATIIDGNQIARVVTFGCDRNRKSVLSGITIQNGKSDYGGGIYCYSSSPSIINCNIRGNSANSAAGGIYCNSSPSTIINCTIHGNSATYGGGIYCNSSSAAIINCTISKNSAVYTGGIYCFASPLAITNCILTENSASYGASGIFCNTCSPKIINTTIYGNSITNIGGSGGGIICYNFSNPDIINCIISGNSAKNGSGVYLTRSSPVIKNCLFWENSSGEVFDSITGTYSKVNDGSTRTDNINADPLFDSPAIGNLHLQSSSPCINAGTSIGAPNTDKDGNPRPIDAGYDIGAYEFGTL